MKCGNLYQKTWLILRRSIRYTQTFFHLPLRLPVQWWKFLSSQKGALVEIEAIALVLRQKRWILKSKLAGGLPGSTGEGPVFPR